MFNYIWYYICFKILFWYWGETLRDWIHLVNWKLKLTLSFIHHQLLLRRKHVNLSLVVLAFVSSNSLIILDWHFCCSYFINLINVEEVIKSCVHLILIYTFFLLYVDSKIVFLKSVLTSINWNRRKTHSKYCTKYC